MKQIDLSIICVYNDEVCLQKHLLESIKKQNVEVELILLDNRESIYPSAAEALNEGVRKARGRYLVLVHQDIQFLSSNTLESIYTFLSSHPNDILGTAGVLQDTYGVYSNMVHGLKKEKAGSYVIEEAMRVDVLDECLLAGHKTIFEAHPFDVEVCNGWDLYVVDLCLQCQGQHDIWVLPLDVWHVSPGNPKHAFYACARHLYKKYRGTHVKKIRTCCITLPLSTRWYSSIVVSMLEFLHIIRS